MVAVAGTSGPVSGTPVEVRPTGVRVQAACEREGQAQGENGWSWGGQTVYQAANRRPDVDWTRVEDRSTGVLPRAIGRSGCVPALAPIRCGLLICRGRTFAIRGLHVRSSSAYRPVAAAVVPVRISAALASRNTAAVARRPTPRRPPPRRGPARIRSTTGSKPRPARHRLVFDTTTPDGRGRGDAATRRIFFSRIRSGYGLTDKRPGGRDRAAASFDAVRLRRRDVEEGTGRCSVGDTAVRGPEDEAGAGRTTSTTPVRVSDAARPGAPRWTRWPGAAPGSPICQMATRRLAGVIASGVGREERTTSTPELVANLIPNGAHGAGRDRLAEPRPGARLYVRRHGVISSASRRRRRRSP